MWLRAGFVRHSYRAILAFRRAQPALRSGKTEFQETLEPVLAFRPTQGAERLTCFFNLGPGSVTLPAPPGSPFGPVLAPKIDRGALRLGSNAAIWLRGLSRHAAGRITLKREPLPFSLSIFRRPR
ncbi:DUF3459 domain-containing protein [Sedimentimonas flavescens]|uniref:DUF3459 domain-containing protein n=1 Tax=Sedimentimonas flavescens TaxID=2851012 RepID=UPI0035CCEA9E